MLKTGLFYENTLLSHLNDIVPKDGYALDCGANIGTHSVFFSGVMGLKTIAFEPIEKNRILLQEAIIQNDLQDLVSIEPVALGDQEGTVHLSAPDPNNPGTFQITQGGEETASVVVLDNFLEHVTSPIRLIKIDVEGFEASVMRGGINTIAKHKPCIVAELPSYAELAEVKSILAPHCYVAVDLFNATPTIVFLNTQENSISWIDRLRNHWRIRRKYKKYEQKLAAQA